ncbi:DNA internalization-related competence protein ComEC/Rec2 [Halioglobus maricola]|nr:DNA internalization-related competence protein ComEC/Rec2 [Halioglobus maricola]
MPAPSAVLYMRAGMLGFVLGVILALASMRLQFIWPLALALLWAWLSPRCKPLLTVTLLAMSLAVVLTLSHAGYWQASRLPDACTGETLLVAGTVVSLPRSSEMAAGLERQRFELAVHSITPMVCSGPRKVLLSYYGPEQIQPGQGWIFNARLKPPRGLANPGSRDFSLWYAETGVHAMGSSGRNARRRGDLDRPVAALHHRVRAQVSGAVANAVGEGWASAMLRAITVADKGGVDRDLWAVFQHLGVNHLLVISGLHVGMLAGAGLLLGGVVARPGSLLGGGQWGHLGPVLALVLAGGYTALAGFSVATSRAFLMLSVAVMAAMLYRRATPWSVVLALTLVLAANPLALLGAGLPLSFSAVAALIWLAAWASNKLRWRGLLAMHCYMSLVMLPLGAIWFGGASLVSAPANFFLVPFFTFFLVPLALLGVVSYLASFTAGAASIWSAAAWPLGVISAGLDSGVMGEAANSVFVDFVPTMPALALAIVGLAVAVVPGAFSRRVLSVALVLPLFLPPQKSAEPVVAVLDVGQGTAVMFAAGGRALLYDTGGGNPAGPNLAQSVVLPYLRARGVASLDALVISHGDRDHAAGSDVVRRSLNPAMIWRGGNGSLQMGERACRAGYTWRWPGDVTFRFLSPAREDQGTSNDRSCVLLIEVRGRRVLLAGDIEQGRERELIRYWRDKLRAEVLLVGHHGSGTSTSQAWLNHVRPAVGLLSYGWGNRFGHPHPQVLQRLVQWDVSSFATATAGALELTLDHRGNWRVSAQRKMDNNWRL